MTLERDTKGLLRLYEEAMKFDDIIHGVTVISSNHRHVHDGSFFHATYRHASLANLATLDILGVAPAGCYPHMQGMYVSLGNAPCDIKNYKDATTSADGTTISSFNRNLNSSSTAEYLFYHTPTVTDVGTLIHDRYVPSPNKDKDAGIITPDLGEEWLLKPSTKYLTRITNNSGGAIQLTFEVLWYEVPYSKI